MEGGQVEAKVVKQGRGEKIKIVKFNRRKHFKKQQGHRQFFTEVEITAIKVKAKAKPKAKSSDEDKE